MVVTQSVFVPGFGSVSAYSWMLELWIAQVPELDLGGGRGNQADQVRVCASTFSLSTLFLEVLETYHKRTIRSTLV